MDDSPEVEVINVTKKFGEHAAVDSVSLAVERGEFLTLLGPSGCGKTTLLRMIAGFEAPDTGRVMLARRDVTELPPYRRDVTTVFQQYALFPHMDVFGNVAFGLERRHLARDEIKRRVVAALDMVRLSGLEARRPAELSGGQQQRVALARALVLEPKVLLLDEPLAALDLKLRQQMQLELKALQRRLGISFIYVTHDQEEALTMSDRVVVMNAGRLEQTGTPEEIYERPLTEFVAGFIGVSNIIEGTLVTSGDSVTVVKLGGVDVEVQSANGADGAHSGRRIRFMVRPEKITLVADSKNGALRGRVESALYLGESTQLKIRLDGGQEITVVEQNRQSSSATSARDRVGQAVSIEWEPGSAVLLADWPGGCRGKI
jgi:spermidine/putrescine transport system ATP-binding protein